MQRDGKPLPLNGNAMQRDGKPLPLNGNAMQRDGKPLPLNGNAMQRDGKPLPLNGNAMQRDGKPLPLNASTVQLGGNGLQCCGNPDGTYSLRGTNRSGGEARVPKRGARSATQESLCTNPVHVGTLAINTYKLRGLAQLYC